MRCHKVSIELVGVAGALLEGPFASCRLSAVTQPYRASTSIVLDLAEGNGERTPRDRCRYLDNARGSAFECAAALDVLVARRALRPDSTLAAKTLLHRVVGMLSEMCLDLLEQEAATAEA